MFSIRNSSGTFEYDQEDDIIWNSACEHYLQEIVLGYESGVHSLSGYERGGDETGDDAVEDDADSQRYCGEVHVIEEYTTETRTYGVFTI